MNRRSFLSATAAGTLSAALPPKPLPILSPWPTPSRIPTDSTLVVIAHEDDDVLAFGAVFPTERSAGKPVYALMVTDGEATGTINDLNGTVVNAWAGYRHDPVAENYQTVSGIGQKLIQQDIINARRAEFERAARCLQVTGFRYLSLPDGNVAAHQAELQAGIRGYATDIVAAHGGLVDLKVHTWINTVTSGTTTTTVEDHPDHLAVGAAAKAVAASSPAWLHTLRFFVLWGLHGSSYPGPSTSRTGVTGTDAARVLMARRCYGDWAPEHGLYAIGDHSVHAALAALEADPHSLSHS